MLSWLTDAFHDLTIEKQLCEEIMMKVHFAELTQPSAQQQSSNPFDLNITIESVVLPTEKRALSTQSKISVKETQNMLGYCHHIVHGAHQVMV